MKRKYIVNILIIVIFELIVIYNIVHPKVSEVYKLYYIDRKLKHWSGEDGLIYKKGTLLSYKTIKPYLSANGWSDAENGFRWSNGKSAKLYFYTPEIDNFKGVLKLKLSTLGEQIVIVKLNNILLDKRALNLRSKFVIYKFDKQLLNKNSLNTLEFSFPNAHRPNNLKDERDLAIAIRELVIK